MKTCAPHNQWVFSLLMSEPPALPNASPTDRVKAYRQMRLKRMVLSALYREFEEAGTNPAQDGTPRV